MYAPDVSSSTCCRTELKRRIPNLSARDSLEYLETKNPEPFGSGFLSGIGASVLIAPIFPELYFRLLFEAFQTFLLGISEDY